MATSPKCNKKGTRMNANELADELENTYPFVGVMEIAAAMLRQQQAEIEALKKDLLKYDRLAWHDLTEAEIQSGFTRVQWAETLIKQLPEEHEGRDSWLLNYGEKK
jgi:hypothetical protein